MTTLLLVKDNWTLTDDLDVTGEERALLNSDDPAQHAEKAALIAALKVRPRLTVSEQDAAAAQTIYAEHMPENATLISAVVELPHGTGIINCRLNNEHLQIRF